MSSKSIAYDISAAIALETAIQMLISEIVIFHLLSLFGFLILSKSGITNTSCIKASFNFQKIKDNFCEVIDLREGGDVDKRSNMVFGLGKRQIVRRMTQQKYLRSFDISQQNSIVTDKGRSE